MKLFMEQFFSLFQNLKVRAWIVPVPGEFHAAEAAHLVAAADQNGDNILSKEEVDSSNKTKFLLPPLSRLRMPTRFSWAPRQQTMAKALSRTRSFDQFCYTFPTFAFT